jgi:hypothetical protein
MNNIHTRAALVVAHPGHELVVYGWLETARPRVFVLTDGSGRSNQSRLGSTSRIISQVGASPGVIYGRLTDQMAYAAILNHEFELFIDFARELGEAFVAEQTDFVAGDAFEGYNPMHDVCRLIINAAVKVASRARARQIANFAFSLVSQSDARPEPPPANEIWLQLDDSALARKMSAAQGYAELAREVSGALERTPVNAFRMERLTPVEADAAARCCDEGPPFYEQYGERQVAAGHYQHVLRYAEHIAPLAEALNRFVASSSAAPDQRPHKTLTQPIHSDK